MLLASCALPLTYPQQAFEGPYKVGPDEGLFLLALDSNLPIQLLRLQGIQGTQHAPQFKNLAQGQHLYLFVIPAGDYRWSRIETPSPWGPTWWNLKDEPDFHVSVEAGTINYSGNLFLHRNQGVYLSIRSFNRSAELLDLLDKEASSLVAALPLRYGGPGRDDFLAYYSEQLNLIQPIETLDQDGPIASPAVQ